MCDYFTFCDLNNKNLWINNQFNQYLMESIINKSVVIPHNYFEAFNFLNKTTYASNVKDMSILIDLAIKKQYFEFLDLV